MDATLQAKLTPLVANTGFIITRPMKTVGVQVKRAGSGFVGISNTAKLEEVEVLVGTTPSSGLSSFTPKDFPLVKTGDLAYIRSDKYTQQWAKDKVTVDGLDEVVDGKSVPLQFIVVPLCEIVMFSRQFAVKVDYKDWFNKNPPTYVTNPDVPYWPSLWPQYPQPPFSISGRESG